jgi:hypothetical protein
LIKVFIGTDPKDWLYNEVLRLSILKRTQSPVEFLELKYIPVKIDAKNISFNRFAIPESCNFQGRAIYLDAKCLVLEDIKKLFELPIKKGVLALPKEIGGEQGRDMDVMVMECDLLKDWNILRWAPVLARDRQVFNRTLWGLPKGLNHDYFEDLPPEWNSSVMPCSLLRGEPGNPEFLRELREAIHSKDIPETFIQKEIRQGNINASLLDELWNQA